MKIVLPLVPIVVAIAVAAAVALPAWCPDASDGVTTATARWVSLRALTARVRP